MKTMRSPLSLYLLRLSVMITLSLCLWFLAPIGSAASQASAEQTLKTLTLPSRSSDAILPAQKGGFPPAPPTLNASAYLLMDFHSGRILAQHHIDTPIEPGSVAKLLTLYIIQKKITEGSLSLNDKVLVSAKAWKMGGSKMFINVHDHVSVHDLLRGIIVSSGNDASIAMAEHIAGTEEAFATQMNHYAAELGMAHSHFTNATGWPDPAMHTTAADLARLSRAIIIETNAEIFPYYAEKSYEYQNIRQENRNRLLWRDIGVDGLKTGHTDNAGYCLAATAQRNGMRLIAIVMGTPSDQARSEETQKLLAYGFQFFETHKLCQAHTALESAPLWMGTKKQIHFAVPEDLYVTIPKGQYEHLQMTLALKSPLLAPITENESVGTLHIRLNDEELQTSPLLSIETVERAGLWDRSKDYLQLRWQQWWS